MKTSHYQVLEFLSPLLPNHGKPVSFPDSNNPKVRIFPVLFMWSQSSGTYKTMKIDLKKAEVELSWSSFILSVRITLSINIKNFPKKILWTIQIRTDKVFLIDGTIQITF